MREGFIEKIILRYSANRGMDKLKDYLEENFCELNAKALLELERGVVFITTGFYVAGYAETDGPVGTHYLAKALKKLGFEVVIITESLCGACFEKDDITVEYVSPTSSVACYVELMERYEPVALYSIERCGRNIYNDYANMRGLSIKEHTSRIDCMFELAQIKGIPTFGIGDGGNEIGMGNLKEQINKNLGLVPCDVSVDNLVIATVSNWGAYGVCAYLQQLSGEQVMPGYEDIKEYLSYIVNKAECVDGVNKEHTCTVDGYPPEVEMEIVNALNEAVYSMAS